MKLESFRNNSRFDYNVTRRYSNGGDMFYVLPILSNESIVPINLSMNVIQLSLDIIQSKSLICTYILTGDS